MPFSDEEIAYLRSQPVARLASVGNDGQPDVVPVAFEFDSARLTDLGKGQVYLAAQRLKERGNMTIAIEGHTDNRGDDSYNQKLGLQRAQTVMTELASLGIDPSRMSTNSVGENKPLVGQDTAWARAINRRVEFQVRPAK